ncbi:MAG: DUF721 domain-containing protein [Bdellovibrionota bacterium]
MAEKDFKTKFKNSAQVLQSLFENGKSPLSEQFSRWKLWANWSEIVGPTIGEQTEPVGISRNVLILWVKSSPWMQQLYYMKEQIRRTIVLKTGLNHIEDIQFTLDRRAVPQEASQQNEIKKFINDLIPEKED